MRRAKYGRLGLQGVFLHKVASDNDFTDETVVQWNVPAVKILF